MSEDIEYTPIKEPTFIEKVIIVATMLLAALVFPIWDRFEDAQKGKQKR